jgi:aspartate aminotransferase
MKLNEEARLLRERGEPVIHLGIGEPKNKAPISALLAAAARLATGDIKYSPSDGIPSLKKAIVRYTEEHYDRIVAPENIIVSSGAKQAIFNLLYAILNPQDEVIILAPYWVSYPEMVKMVYGVPVVVTPEDGSFYPRMADIERSVTSYTKAIIINSPNNPSGVMFSEEFLAQIIEFCERKGIYCLMDDIYHQLVFDGRKAPSCFQFTKKDAESTKVIAINGIAKLYGMTGFRIGWTVASRELTAVMSNIQSQTTSCASVLLQAAAEGALLGIQGIVENLRLHCQNNRDIVMADLKTLPGVKCTRPQGTFYCMPDFRAYLHPAIASNSVQLSEFLLRKARVVTVPGKEFGFEGYLRLSVAGTVKDVTEGILRIKWAIDPTSPNEIFIGDKKLVRDWL